MTCRRCAQDTILSDEELLDSICSTNLGYELHYFRVVVSSISTDDKKAVFCTFGYRQEDTSHERLAIMGLLKDGDLLSESRSEYTISQLFGISRGSKTSRVWGLP